MNEKIDKANKLRIEIEQIIDLLDIIKDGQTYDTKYKSQNTFSCLEINAHVCTGSQSSRHNKKIDNNETITKFCNAGSLVLREELSKKQLELEALFK